MEEGKREGSFIAGKEGRSHTDPVESHTEISIIKNQAGNNGISNLGEREREIKKGLTDRINFLGPSANSMAKETLISSLASKVMEVIHKPSTLVFSNDVTEEDKQKAIAQDKIKTVRAGLAILMPTLVNSEQTLEYQARYKDNNNDNIAANLDCLNQVMAVVLNSLLGKTIEELADYKDFFGLCLHVISNIESQRDPMFLFAAEKREALARVIDAKEAELALAYAELERLNAAGKVAAPVAKSGIDLLKEKVASGGNKRGREGDSSSSSSSSSKQQVFSVPSTFDQLGNA